METRGTLLVGSFVSTSISPCTLIYSCLLKSCDDFTINSHTLIRKCPQLSRYDRCKHLWSAAHLTNEAGCCCLGCLPNARGQAQCFNPLLRPIQWQRSKRERYWRLILMQLCSEESGVRELKFEGMILRVACYWGVEARSQTWDQA